VSDRRYWGRQFDRQYFSAQRFLGTFDQQLERSAKQSLRDAFGDQARQLGVTSLIVEVDIQLPTSQRRLLNRSFRHYEETDCRKEPRHRVVFDVPGACEHNLGQGCLVNDALFLAGSFMLTAVVNRE